MRLALRQGDDDMGVESKLHHIQRLDEPAGRLIKALDVAQFALDAHVIISLAEGETHNVVGFTGATKNLFGLVPGITKIGYHAKLPGAEQFCEMLLDLTAFLKPAFTLM